jgi:anti-sigma factor RsiW
MTDVHALAGAYVLDAIDDVERAAFVRHLAECAECAAETDELRATVTHLADSAWSVPPPRLKAEVLARVAQTRQERPKRRDSDRSGRSRWRLVSAVAAAVVALGAAGGVAGVAVHDQQVTQQRTRAQNEQIRAILGAPDAVVRRGNVTGGGQLTVVTSAARDAGVALLTGAPAIPNSRAYELWLVKGHAEPAGVMAAGSTSDTTVFTGLSGTTEVAMTNERAAGAQTPSDILVAIDV